MMDNSTKQTYTQTWLEHGCSPRFKSPQRKRRIGGFVRLRNMVFSSMVLLYMNMQQVQCEETPTCVGPDCCILDKLKPWDASIFTSEAGEP